MKLNLKILSVSAMALLFACKNSDRNALFNDEELKIIEGLIITSVTDDPTNAYDTNSSAATLGQKFFFDPKFSGPLLVSGTILDTADLDGDSSYTDVVTVSGAVTRSSTTTNASNSISGLTTTADIDIGMKVIGSGIPAGVTVSGKTATTVTISANATASATVSLTYYVHDNAVSCATCHNPAYSFADITSSAKDQADDTSIGAKAWTGRNVPTVLNSVFNKIFLWTGNADTQWGLISRPIEGGPHGFGRVLVVDRICDCYMGTNTAGVCTSSAVSDYTSTFGNTITDATSPCMDIDTLITAGTCSLNVPGKYNDACYNGLSAANQTLVNTIFTNFTKSIAAYERQAVSQNSLFDQWAKGNDSVMSADAQRGLKIFIGKGNCISCHNTPSFSDSNFHNIGIPQEGTFADTEDKGAYTGLSQLFSDTSHNMFAADGSYSDSTSYGSTLRSAWPTTDAGRLVYLGAFKTPPLRSVNRTGPYMHTGRYKNLWDVVNHYSFGGAGSGYVGTLDGRIHPRNLNNWEMLDLIAFLNALEGETLSSSITTRPTGIP